MRALAQVVSRRLRLIVERQTSLSVSYLLYAVALGISGAVQLGLLFVLARLLPAPEFGVASLLMVSIPLVARLVTLGSDIGLAIRIWKRPRDEQRADLNAMLGWTAVTTAVALPFGLLVWFVVSADLHPLFFVFALLAAALRSCTEIFQAMLQREGHTARVGIMIVTRALLFGCVCAGIVVYVDASSFAYLCGVLAAEGLAAAWAVVQQGDPTGGLLPIFSLPASNIAVGVGLMTLMGLVAGALPAVEAMRLRITNALRKT